MDTNNNNQLNNEVGVTNNQVALVNQNSVENANVQSISNNNTEPESEEIEEDNQSATTNTSSLSMHYSFCINEDGNIVDKDGNIVDDTYLANLKKAQEEKINVADDSQVEDLNQPQINNVPIIYINYDPYPSSDDEEHKIEHGTKYDKEFANYSSMFLQPN